MDSSTGDTGFNASSPLPIQPFPGDGHEIGEVTEAEISDLGSTMTLLGEQEAESSTFIDRGSSPVFESIHGVDVCVGTPCVLTGTKGVDTEDLISEEIPKDEEDDEGERKERSAMECISGWRPSDGPALRREPARPDQT